MELATEAVIASNVNTSAAVMNETGHAGGGSAGGKKTTKKTKQKTFYCRARDLTTTETRQRQKEETWNYQDHQGQF